MYKIVDVAKSLGIKPDDLIPYGTYKAKIRLGDLISLPRRGKYILVSAMTPTKSGEGKTTTTIGLAMAFNRYRGSAVACIRQPSLGPYLGIKGGGTGGGKCRVEPEEEVNLHFTGDNYAVSTAHNFVSAVLDNHLYRGNALGIDISTLNWPRAVDVSDAALREVIVGINWDRKSRYFPHKGQFCITAASELMSILALSRDEEDFKRRIESIVLAFSETGSPIKVRDLELGPAIYQLMKEAIMPNLVQASDGTPVLVHAGPFANISVGASSIIADKIALGLADYVFTEAGFGMDCGGEKFVNIKSRISSIPPDGVVLVVSNKALGEYGMENLSRHVEVVRAFSLPVIILVNVWPSDSERDVERIVAQCRTLGVDAVVVSQLYSMGTQGAETLVKEVDRVLSRTNPKIRFSYSLEQDLFSKIEAVATKVYGAGGVEYEPMAREKITMFQSSGYDKLMVCIAKTQYSFGHYAGFRPGRGEPFLITDAFLSAGAGFVVAVAGSITTLPGLPSRPRALDFSW